VTIHPIDAATAIVLEGQASGRSPLVPIFSDTHPELARLLMIQIENGTIPPNEYAQAKLVLGKSVRQIQRNLAKLRQHGATPTPPARRQFELTLQHKQVIFACQGNVELAYEQLIDAGEELPHVSTFWRRWYAQPMGVQAYARHGAQGLVRFWLYPRFEAQGDLRGDPSRPHRLVRQRLRAAPTSRLLGLAVREATGPDHR
jgi:hypothetical protein